MSLRHLKFTFLCFCITVFLLIYKQQSNNAIPSALANTGITLTGVLEPASMKMEKIYAPVLYFDSQEKAPLTSIDTYLKTGVSMFAYLGFNHSEQLKPSVGFKDLLNNPSKFVLYQEKNGEIMLQSYNRISPAADTVYSRKIQKHDFTYIQYWFFYSLNDSSSTGLSEFWQKCGNHQSDWEHIALKIDNLKYQRAKKTGDYLNAIEALFFSQHNPGQNDQRKFKKPGDAQVHFEETHVRAFPARGTHATYYEPLQNKGYPLVNIIGLQLYDYADGKGRRLETRNILQNMNTLAWFRYGGRWGAINDDYCSIIESISKASNDGDFGPFQQVPLTDWDIYDEQKL